MKYTPDVIESLEPHQIVVFGSNTNGYHGKGFALTCRLKFGAKYGQANGLQGQSYAIITKDLKKGKRSIPLDMISLQLEELISFAINHPHLEFLLTKIGTKLAGYSEKELENLIKKLNFPKNIILPKFENHLDKWFDVLI